MQEEVEFDTDVNPLQKEYTIGAETHFWAFDFVVSKDGKYIKLAFGACEDDKECVLVDQIFPIEVALFAAQEAVEIAVMMLDELQEKFDKEKEHDWIKDTYLKDIEQQVDAWCATRIREQGKLH